MSGPGSQLQSPYPSWKSRYLPPPDKHYLKLDLPYLSSQVGWAARFENGQVVNLGSHLTCDSNDPTDSFAATCAALSRGLNDRSDLDPKIFGKIFTETAGSKIWDKLYDLAHDHGSAFWKDVPGTKTNVLTKKPASVGNIDSEGNFVPTAPDGVISGAAIPSPAISIGRRFPFASHNDVHLYMYLDKDAYPDQLSGLVAGGAVGIEGTTSGGTKVKLRFGVGRDSSGGPAGYLTLHLGPDNLPYQQAP